MLLNRWRAALRWALLAVLICAGSPSVMAQELHHPRDLAEAFRAEPKLQLGLDSRRSFISNRDVKLMGVKCGLEFDAKIRLGFGVYFLISPFRRNFIVDQPPMGTDTVAAQLRFSYMSIFGEYVLFTSKRWEVAIPLHLGFGDAGFPEIPQSPLRGMFLTELSAFASYKIFPWIGLGGGLGYRSILVGGASIRENFDAPIYSFGVKLWLGYIWKKVFPPED